MKEWHFYDKVYRRWVVVFIGPRKELAKELKNSGYKHNDIEEFVATAQGCHIQLDETNNDIGNRCHIIWMPKLDLGTLVHELGHLVMSIFKRVGVELDEDNQEIVTFYQEFWFNEIRKTIRKHPSGLSHKEVTK